MASSESDGVVEFLFMVFAYVTYPFWYWLHYILDCNIIPNDIVMAVFGWVCAPFTVIFLILIDILCCGYRFLEWLT